MIQVVVITPTTRDTKVVDPETSVKSVLDECGVDYANGGVSLDGATLIPGQINQTFSSFGISDKCFLTKVAKQDNA